MIRLNPQLQHAIIEIGGERQPVLVVDNVLAEPDQLIEQAAGLAFAKAPSSFYPGVQAATPADYAALIRDRLAPLVAQMFGLPATLELRESNLSLVTIRPEHLHPLQRIPHIDSSSLSRLAILHYLCGPDMGGTTFFRHRRSGFEVITPERSPAYAEATKQDFAEFGDPVAGYHGLDSAAYEVTASIEARFNRLIVYRSAILHSGLIPERFDYSADPRTGRLTVNTFADLVRKAPGAFIGGGALSFMR